MDGITVNLLFLGAGLIGAYLLFQHLNRRKIDDQRAAFWANVKEPLCYRSQDIEDTEVTQRAENARKRLREHGNVWITPADVYCWVYRSDADDATADFMAWADLRDRQAQDTRKAFRELKARQMAGEGNPTGAAELFGQQKTAV